MAEDGKKGEIRLVVFPQDREPTEAVGYATVCIVLSQGAGYTTGVHRFVHGDEGQLLEMIGELVMYVDEQVPGFMHKVMESIKAMDFSNVTFHRAG